MGVAVGVAVGVRAVGELVRAGAFDLGDESDALDDAGQSLRYSGCVALVYVQYSNLADITAPPTFAVTVTRFPKAEHKTVQVVDAATTVAPASGIPSARRLYNRHGVKLVFLQGGTIAMFALDVLLVQLVSALGLLSVATLIVEYAMLYCFPQRQLYNQVKVRRVGSGQRWVVCVVLAQYVCVMM